MHAGFVQAFTDSLSTVFLVAACVAALAFALSWFLKALPLRQTVGAGTGVGEAFAAPRSVRSLPEIEREVSVLSSREAGALLISRVAERAEVTLAPGECWALAHLGTPSRLEIDPARVAALRQSLAARGLAEQDGEAWSLTAEGQATLERLLAAGRERLGELLAEWEPGEHRELGELIERLAREFLLDAGPLHELVAA